jgi:hypothetical protein
MPRVNVKAVQIVAGLRGSRAGGASMPPREVKLALSQMGEVPRGGQQVPVSGTA